MGEQKDGQELDAANLRLFMQRVLTDLRALEKMIDEGIIEQDKRRIGAEQELFLVDRNRQPSPLGPEILQDLDPAHFTSELGRFNLEFNLDPFALGGDCLRRMESQLNGLLDQARKAARDHGADVVLIGILPTLAKRDLGLDNMTPEPRYKALNDAIHRLRGKEFEFLFKGPDELRVTHDNVMLEACNTSFQVHFQVSADEFARFYNVAQMAAAPVLAAAVNSPLLFGKRLWRETRIALFQQSIDTRTATSHVREQSPRVSFGRGWIRESVLEIFREDITRFRVLLGAEIEEDPFEALARGKPPRLAALCLHNSTVYRWNRPCYGISEGKPHLRIENRVLPSGPTPIDEVSNAAFWLGLIRGLEQRHDDVTKVMEFDAAKENLLAAARLGLSAQFTWPGRQAVPVTELISEELLPLSRGGLEELGIDGADIDRYLGVIEERVESRRTGAQWLLDSLARMTIEGSRSEPMAALTAATIARQEEGEPGHRWPLATIEDAGGWVGHYTHIGQFMTTDLFTVNQDELVDLVASVMDWQHVRHVPVEDNQHRLVGLVSHRTLLRFLAKGRATAEPMPVSEVMVPDVITTTPETTTLEAITLMRKHEIGCLPVVKGDRLVGIVTERDFLDLSGDLLEGRLRSKEPQS